MNLDFGISTCFVKGLDFYSYTWLQFAFPFYLWGLIGLIIFASKFSTRIGKLFGSNPVAVLATVILMSYTKLLHTSQEALSYATLQYSNGTEKKVWKLDPNLTYFEGKHIPLAFFAISVICFLIVPYILLLLFGYCLQALSDKRGFHCVNKLKPFLDAYYAPYKKNTRYWPGFMLIVRTILYISYIFIDHNEGESILIVKSLIFAGIAVLAWLKNHIYEKIYLDVLEASFILNIIILTVTTYHIRVLNGNQLIVSNISAGVAFVEFIGIVVFHVLLRIWDKAFFQKFKNSYEYIKKKVNEVFFRRKPQSIAETMNLNITATACIREPLLEESIN